MKLLEKAGVGLIAVPALLFCPWLAFGMIKEPTATTMPMWWAAGVVIGLSVALVGFALVFLASRRGQ